MQFIIDAQEKLNVLPSYTIRASSGTVSFRGLLVDQFGNALSSELNFQGITTTEQTFLNAYRTLVSNTTATFPGGASFIGSVYGGTLVVGFRGMPTGSVDSSGPAHTASFTAGAFRLGAKPQALQPAYRGAERLIAENTITVGLTASALNNFFTPSPLTNFFLFSNTSSGTIYGRFGGQAPTASVWHFQIPPGVAQPVGATYGMPILLLGSAASLSTVVSEFDGNGTIPLLAGMDSGSGDISLASILAQLLPATGTGVPTLSEQHPGLEYVCGLGSGGTTTVVLEALGPTKRVVAVGISVTFSTTSSGLASRYNTGGGTFNATTMKSMRVLSVSGVPFVRNTGGDGAGAVTIAPVDGVSGITLPVGTYSQQDVGFGWGYGA